MSGEEEDERLPRAGRAALERLIELNRLAVYHIEDGRPKIRTNWLYADGALADAATELARQREYLRADLEPLLKRLEQRVRQRDKRIAQLEAERRELEAELARLRGAAVWPVPRERTGTGDD